MFKVLEAESDDEENYEVKEALGPRRFGEETEWTEVVPKKVAKQKREAQHVAEVNLEENNNEMLRRHGFIEDIC